MAPHIVTRNKGRPLAEIREAQKERRMEMLRLREEEGLTYTAIAERYGISRVAAFALCYRARTGEAYYKPKKEN